MIRTIAFIFLSCLLIPAFAQDYRWQQHVNYTMNVHLDVKTHRVTGVQNLVYQNNSNDTLTKLYYHLYFNAFQPGSMMDVRSRTIADPDRRVMDRISKLSESEIGYQRVLTLKQDNKDVKFAVVQTILEVTLAKPILPHQKTQLDMTFESQVPLQVRRSGRDNREGIAYSMTQWYPKLAEYDFQGWHADQYVAREFHGVWGDFDVTISLDPTFIVAGTGTLQDPEKIGYGYEKPGTKVSRPSGDLSWHFVAKNVIDFAWAADPEYTHDQAVVPGGPVLHFFYQKTSKTEDSWSKLKDYAVKVFQYNNVHYGRYPFETYSIIQGGDGGMEYPMCTLILGQAGSARGLAGLMAHEVTHSWYQMALASNESLYPWMDEGFTDFASAESMAFIFGHDPDSSHRDSYAAYFDLVNSGKQEPISQHSDHFATNRAYSTGSYSMGAIMLEQLKYLIGDAAFYKGFKLYYNEWSMRHPEPNDFIRVMEKVSGLQLHWYLRYWVSTTRRIDYGISGAEEKDGTTQVSLARMGDFPMPVDIQVTFVDGKKEMFYVPMNELLGNKAIAAGTTRTDLATWSWVNPTYVFMIARPKDQIASIEIDPLQRMADINRSNNKLQK